jgi:hypothetical protein
MNVGSIKVKGGRRKRQIEKQQERKLVPRKSMNHKGKVQPHKKQQKTEITKRK